jgi:hypothetical protein
MAACSKQASKMDAVVGSSNPGCLSAASWSLVWSALLRSPDDICGKTDGNNQNFVYSS